MAAAMDGLDALVFTGGVGEHAAAIRERATDGLGFLGIRVDALRNSTARADSELGAFDSKVRVLVIEAREDIEIAREVRAALAGGQAA
jgi:acetate kinase